MFAKLGRLVGGSTLLLRGLAHEPGVVTQLPQWFANAGTRKAPLEHRQPWWNFRAVEFVESRLTPGARVFEFGGGASTLWLIDRGAHVTTIEHDEEWFSDLQPRIRTADLRLVPTPQGDYSSYVGSIEQEPEESIDLVIVDGLARSACALAATSKVRVGGMLLLDDTQWSDHVPADRSNLTRLRQDYVGLAASLDRWPVFHLRGMKPGTWLPVQTTVWIKPVI